MCAVCGLCVVCGVCGVCGVCCHCSPFLFVWVLLLFIKYRVFGVVCCGCLLWWGELVSCQHSCVTPFWGAVFRVIFWCVAIFVSPQ